MIMKIFAIFLVLSVTLIKGENLRIHRIDKLGSHSPTSPRFDHKEARAEAKIVFSELAKENHWDFTQSSDSEIFTDEGLANLDVIIFDNNSGLMLNETEKQAFEKWVHNGGGVVGIHGVTHAHKHVNESNKAEWPFWYRLWGVLHKTGPKNGPKGRRGYGDWIQMENTTEKVWHHHLPKRWQLNKVEWYFWNYHRNFESKNIIATAEAKMNQPELPSYYPVTWHQEFEGGRIWYTNMGHYAENFRQKEFIQHVLDGIEWVAGNDANIDAIPESLKRRAIGAKNSLFEKLSGKLMEVMSADGPVKAIEVCGNEAMKMAHQTGKEFNLKIGRTALKLRNPKNAPPAWALPLFSQAQQKPLYQKLSQHQASALFPIRLKAQCLTCHGDKKLIPQNVQKKLKERYPKDDATGFKVNDLRGWFWVEMELESNN